MGKLNIAHHKSYHPYRRDNIERVRRDEEEARLKEAKEEGRMMLADSEARIDFLRQRAGITGNEGEKILPKEETEQEEQAPARGQLPTINGHINLFQEAEASMVNAIAVTKKTESNASDRGFKLAPDEKELKRWYTQRRQDDLQDNSEDDDRSKREAQRKYRNDPLTAIELQLASRSEASSSSSSGPSHQQPKPRTLNLPTSTSSPALPTVNARLQRESSERERALALIKRKKKELEGNMTPSTTYGDDEEGYRDVYNRKAVEDAHRGRETRKHRDRRHDW